MHCMHQVSHNDITSASTNQRPDESAMSTEQLCTQQLPICQNIAISQFNHETKIDTMCVIVNITYAVAVKHNA